MKYLHDLILTLELTDRCNFRCRMCDQAHGSPHGRDQGFMRREVFDRVMVSLADFPVTLLTPYWVGESLLHPEFDEMTREMFAANRDNRLFRHYNLNTNAALLDEDITRILLDCAAGETEQDSALYAPDSFVRIHFSLDALHPPTYRRIKGAADMGRTEANVRHFLEEYARRGLSFPKFNLAIIVMEENRHEVGEFVRFWQKVCGDLGLPVTVTHDWPEGCANGIYVRRLDTDRNQKEAEELHRRVAVELGLVKEAPPGERIIRSNAVLKEDGKDHNIGRRPCSGPFKTPIVHWSGRVSVCCFDVGLQHVIGDIRKESLREVWTGTKAHALRMAHIRGDFRAFPACAGCTNLNTPLLPDDEIRDYLRQTGEDESLWPKSS